MIDNRFPDLVALITKINAEQAKLRSAGLGSTLDPAHPTDDPKYRALQINN
jgi:hypothetical protein